MRQRCFSVLALRKWPSAPPGSTGRSVRQRKRKSYHRVGELLERSYINKMRAIPANKGTVYEKTIDKDYASVRTEIVVKRDANVESWYQRCDAMELADL